MAKIPFDVACFSEVVQGVPRPLIDTRFFQFLPKANQTDRKGLPVTALYVSIMSSVLYDRDPV